jgi:xanthine dehydrogenase YagS FAD-binding subunit
MRAFEHWKASNLATTLSLLKEPGTEAYGGGTDLLGELKREIREIERLINLKGLADLGRISTEKTGDLKIGALCTLEEIGSRPQIKNRYPSLVQAIATVATPQLRNVGTLGGSLCQHPRCWYFRNRLFPCWLKGGQRCFAVDGENPYHSILGRGMCQAVHPSDLAAVLVSLDAKVRIAGQRGNRKILLEDLYRKPGMDQRQMTILQRGELITDVLIPRPPAGSRAIYLKSTERKAWAFALASVAVRLVVRGDNNAVKEGRIVLGGVAPGPWRSKEAEQVLVNRKLTEETMIKTSEAALAEARPLHDNKYKVPLAKGLIRKALDVLRSR